ncbi:MAG: hypothetical protein ING41_12555 [Burkholderiales bacterium]|jgi:hypothetical protein|nr:hypothetical protein [Burkholderiales bacterium]
MIATDAAIDWVEIVGCLRSELSRTFFELLKGRGIAEDNSASGKSVATDTGPAECCVGICCVTLSDPVAFS